MQVDGRHFEEAPPMGQFEISDLDNVTQRFADRDDCDDRQQGPLAGHQGDHADRRAQRKRTGITHEKLGRVDVEP